MVVTKKTAVWINTMPSCGPIGSASRPSHWSDSLGNVASIDRRPQ